MPRTSLVSKAIATIPGFAQRYEFLREYNNSISNQESTFDRYATQFAKFCLHFNRFPDEVTNEEFVEYYSTLRKQNPSAGTMKLAIYSVRLYFDAIGKVPPRHAVPPVKEPKRVPTFLTELEANILIQSGETRKDRVTNGGMLALGLRAQEMVNLKLEDINLESLMVCVRASKGNKDRMVPIPPTYGRILKDYIRESQPQTYLIEKEPGVQVSVGYLRYRLKKAAIRSGINKRIYLHLFRSTYAIQNILNGLNIYSLSKYMGHSSIVTTAQYLKALPDNVFGNAPLAFETTFSPENQRKVAELRPDLFIR